MEGPITFYSILQFPVLLSQTIENIRYILQYTTYFDKGGFLMKYYGRLYSYLQFSIVLQQLKRALWRALLYSIVFYSLLYSYHPLQKILWFITIVFYILLQSYHILQNSIETIIVGFSSPTIYYSKLHNSIIFLQNTTEILQNIIDYFYKGCLYSTVQQYS